MYGRRYAQDTAVPIARSRAEIDKLLRKWKVTGIQWTDEFDKDRVTLQFAFPHEGRTYGARFTLRLPTREDLKGSAIHGGTGRLLEARLQKLLDGRGKQEHRLLLLWLTAAFNAVAGGLVPVEQLFLPFLVDESGRTVGEIIGPKLHKLGDGRGIGLLMLPEARP